MCGLCGVVCGDFEIFQSSPVRGLCGVVETLNFFEIPMCVLWCVGTLKFFKVPLCVRLCPCTGEIEFSQKNPCTGDFPLCWRDCFFQVKNPCAGDFSPVVEHQGTKKKTLLYSSFQCLFKDLSL